MRHPCSIVIIEFVIRSPPSDAADCLIEIAVDRAFECRYRVESTLDRFIELCHRASVSALRLITRENPFLSTLRDGLLRVTQRSDMSEISRK